MKNRIIDFLSICRKAGKLTYGAAQTIEMMKYGKVVCVLIMSDVSEKTLKEINFANKSGISVLHLNNTKDELKQVLKTACGVVGITDENMKNKIISLAEAQNKEE